MELKKQIYDLLEPDERERFISQKDQERFEKQCAQFVDRAVLPVFKRIQEEFNIYGRAVHIARSSFPIILPGFYPRLHITVPEGRTFSYWVKIKRNRDRFCIEHHHSIESEDGIPDVCNISLPQKRQLLVDDLAEVREEHIQRDIIELYEHHIIMNKNSLRHHQ